MSDQVSIKPIQILDPILANQIAAGEVVERPASAVKELLENALDAGGTSITLEIKDGGRQLIRVVDNGHGMTKDNVLLAIERHATSKISSIDDLHKIQTLGFRGEALPSIASVSKLSIKTRTVGQQTATQLQLKGGHELHVSQSSGRVGTEIKVEDLFFNVPARRKFLKSKQTEAGMIHEAIQRLAICYPQIAFRFIKDGHTSINVPIHNTSIERLNALFGSHVVQQLYPIQWHGALQIDGFLSHPLLTYSAHRHAYAFINGRFVKDRIFLGAIQRAFAQKLPKGRFPFYVLQLTVHPSMVDVNVHPAKTEVRFANEEAILDLLTKALRVTVSQMNLKESDTDQSYNQWQLNIDQSKNPYQQPSADSEESSTPSKPQEKNYIRTTQIDSPPPVSHSKSSSASASKSTLSPEDYRARIQARLERTSFEEQEVKRKESVARHDVIHITQNDLQAWKSPHQSSPHQSSSAQDFDSQRFSQPSSFNQPSADHRESITTEESHSYPFPSNLETSTQSQSHRRHIGRADSWWIQEAEDALLLTHTPTAFACMLSLSYTTTTLENPIRISSTLDPSSTQHIHQYLSFYGWNIQADRITQVPCIFLRLEPSQQETWIIKYYEAICQQCTQDHISHQSKPLEFVQSYIQAVQTVNLTTALRGIVLQWIEKSEYPKYYQAYFQVKLTWQDLLKQRIPMSAEQFQISPKASLELSPNTSNAISEPPLEIDADMIKKIF